MTRDLTIFSTPWCGYCVRLKRALDDAGVRYVEVDISADEVSADLVMTVNGGNQTVPTVLFPDGGAMTNPTLADVVDRLGRNA
ncbi:MAG: mycoredoxin [Mycobacteriales bacterium]